jgi:hypothetical protein
MPKEKQKKIVSEPKVAPKELSADELKKQIESLQEKLNVVEPPPVIDVKERQRQRIEAERVRENRLVEGIFRFHERPGGTMKKVPFRKYPGDPIIKRDFTDGQRYKIPLWLAKHLNQGCSYPVHMHKQNASGRPTMDIGSRVNRCSFESLEFIDITDKDSLATMGPSKLVNVEIR